MGLWLDLIRGLTCTCAPPADVVPQSDLADLTADDLQLLLSGTGGFITLEDCRSVAEFKDMRGPEIKVSDPKRLEAFEELFWERNTFESPHTLGF